MLGEKLAPSTALRALYNARREAHQNLSTLTVFIEKHADLMTVEHGSTYVAVLRTQRAAMETLVACLDARIAHHTTREAA